MIDEAADPRVAVGLFLNKKVSGSQLLRCLASHTLWRVPARLEGLVPIFQEYELSPGELHFLMFSDPEAYLRCRDHLGIEALGEYFIDRVPGSRAFSSITEEVSVVNINPFNPEEIHYTKQQIPRLRAWAQIIKVEQALETISGQRPDYAVLKSFPEYYFVMEDTQFIALAPDTRGRKLAALFTADDALEIFLDEHRDRGELKPIPIDGEKLFSAVKRMPLDGLVFNCCGPIRPRAFPLTFCDEILNKG